MAKVALDSKAMSFFLVRYHLSTSTHNNQLSEKQLKKGVHAFPDISTNTENIKIIKPDNNVWKWISNILDMYKNNIQPAYMSQDLHLSGQ